MYYKQEIGRMGENIATSYLEKKGYQIIERNFMARQGEIDIIAKDKEEIVFIEVKTRTNQQYGNPIDGVNTVKQKHLIQTVEYYLYKHHLENSFVRIDVIEVYLYPTIYRICHRKQII